MFTTFNLQILNIILAKHALGPSRETLDVGMLIDGRRLVEYAGGYNSSVFGRLGRYYGVVRGT